MEDFNPFGVLGMSVSFGRRVSGALVGAIIATVAITSATVAVVLDGSSGTFGDVQVGDDVRRIVDDGFGAARPEFPLLRDFATQLLAAIIVITGALVWRQWQLFSLCLGRLHANGVLVPKAVPEFSRWHVVLGYRFMADGGDMDRFVRRVNTGVRIMGYLSTVVALVSFGLALMLLQSYESLGMFRLWNVDGSGVTDGRFAEAAYEGWWASGDNFAGHLAYLLIATIGIFVILLQNIVGLAAVYVVAGFPAFCDFDADWFDRDGNFGWRPAGIAFRTVRWSLLIHGLALTVLFALVGAGVWAYTLPLLFLWLLVIPLYLGVPALVFRRITADIKGKALAGLATSTGADLVAAASAVPFVRQSGLKPLRVSRFGVYAFGASVLLPIVLTVAQIVGTS